MLLVNQKPIENLAMQEESHPMRVYAKEYQAGVKYLKDTFGEFVSFKRPKFPKRTKGLDHRNREVANMAIPSPPLLMPLTARSQGRTGIEIWEYCDGMPKMLGNGLWQASGKRSKFISETLVLNLNNDPELAFFIFFKSPLFSREGKNGKVSIKQLVIDDPALKAKMEGDKARAELELQTALYGILEDESQLKIVAQSWAVPNVDKKHPDLIRQELKTKVLEGDKKKKHDPMSKGIKEFLSEIKVTDAVRLRSLVKISEDSGKITWSPDGRYRIGERELVRVPLTEVSHKFDYLCNHLGNVANRPKLQEMLRDTVDKDYLDKIADDKSFSWLARIMELKYSFKSPEDIRDLVYACFVEPTYEAEEIEEKIEADVEEVKEEPVVKPVVKKQTKKQ